jgi:DNA primase
MSLRCPFHKGGKESTPSFSVNITNGVWQCFTCKASGSLPKLLRQLGLRSEVIDAELKDIRGELDANRERLKWKKKSEIVNRDPFLATTILPEVLLRPYEFCPTRLTEVGFSAAWLHYMDVGFDRVNNRIIYPIRDVYGNLAGVSGGATIAGQYPKYKVYQGRRTDPQTQRLVGSDFGPWFDELYPEYVFHNHHYLWNFDQIYPRLFFGKGVQTLIIVEGFKACLWLLQNGYPNTVALMGSSMSERQSSLLHRLRVDVVLFLDQDDAGRKGTKKIAQDVRKFQTGVRVAHYPYAEDCQPDDLTPAEVAASIEGSLMYSHWLKGTRT